MIDNLAVPLQEFWQDCTNGSPAKFLSAGNIPKRQSEQASLHLWIPSVRGRAFCHPTIRSLRPLHSPLIGSAAHLSFSTVSICPFGCHPLSEATGPSALGGHPPTPACHMHACGWALPGGVGRRMSGGRTPRARSCACPQTHRFPASRWRGSYGMRRTWPVRGRWARQPRRSGWKRRSRPSG